MIFFNLMTCSSPPNTWGTGIMSGCSQSWLILMVIFLLVMILRRQTEDGFLSGVGFNVIGAGVLGIGAAIVLTTLFGQPRWELLAGLVGVGIGGFGLALFGGSE